VPRPSAQRQGVELIGAAIVYFLLIFFALITLLIPSAIVGAVGIVVGLYLFGAATLPSILVAVAVPIAAVIAVECFVLLHVVGAKYEEFDFATEVTVLGEQ
jgi:MFS superfamily sulfate permease-like transporter